MYNMTPEAILREIISNPDIERDTWTCIITGNVGPTGKTWLCERLRERGYKAVEISESLAHCTQYDDGNRFFMQRFSKTVVVVLSRKLDTRWMKLVNKIEDSIYDAGYYKNYRMTYDPTSNEYCFRIRPIEEEQ